MVKEKKKSTLKPKTGGKLTPKQFMFIEEYLLDFNGKQSAIRAGYSQRSATLIAYELLNLPKYQRVQDAIKKRLEARKAQLGFDQLFVVESLQEVLARCKQAAPVMRYNPLTKKIEPIVDEQGRNVWQFDSVGANRAAELLGRHLGMFDSKMLLPEDPNAPKQPINITIIQQTKKDDLNEVQASSNTGSKHSVEPDRKASHSVQPSAK